MTSPIARWDLPAVEGANVVGRRKNPTVNELENIERAAREEARTRGYEEGLAAARLESQRELQKLAESVQHLSRVVEFLSQPLQELDTEVSQQLATLAVTVARHLVRRELSLDPSQVIAIIRESVQLLPVSARDVRVHLHPADAAVVRERLSQTTGDRAWTIVEDPVLARGGCRVTTETAHIDARLETRLDRAVAAVLGEDRLGGRP